MSAFLALFNFLLMSIFLSSCSGEFSVARKLDVYCFELSGGTIFSSPLKVTTKQLHLDTGELFGKDVVFEGAIAEKGESSTYAIIKDEDGRMLVVLTNVDQAFRVLERTNTEYVRVLGRLERGKKGFPYILARAIRAYNPSRP